MKTLGDINYWIYKYFIQDPHIFVEYDEHGIPWFIANRVAFELGYTKSLKTIIRDNVSPENKKLMKVQTPGGLQNMMCISLEGLYELISRSRTDLATFYRNMTNLEVYPTLFKTGAYISDIEQYTNEEVLKWPIQMPEKDYENIYNKSIERKELQRKLHKKD